MTRFRTMFTIAALALPLMGATCNQQAQSIAVRTCNALDVIYEHYDAVVDGGVVPLSVQKRVGAVRGQTDKICAAPSTVTTTRLLTVAAEAYIALRAAFAYEAGQGDTNDDAVEGLEKLENLRAMLERYRK